MTHTELAKLAIQAKATAFPRFSNFHVGAALLAKNGTVYTGCNIESAAYSPTCCAERTALVKAVSDGLHLHDFTAIAVAGGFPGDEPEYCYPCGVCRQMLYEFGGNDLEVIVAKTEEDYKLHTMAELLPHGFGDADLKRN